MKSEVRLIAVVGLVLVLVAGCDCWRQSRRPDPSPLGTLSDPIWQTQETNAEHSDFVIYQHEFKKDSEVLNLGGEDHVKEIAARLLGGQEAKVVVERSMMSSRPDTEYKYPVHPNPKLDLRRREIVVRSLTAMGVNDADQRVLVAPALAIGITGNEAEGAYHRGMSADQWGSSGMGGMGGFGGFMFRGGF